MTTDDLKDQIDVLLTPPVIDSSKVAAAIKAVVDFFSAQDKDIFPDWLNTMTFNTDATGDGKYCKLADNTGKIRVFQTKTDGNINHQPPTDTLINEDAYWKVVSPSAASGIPEWTPGVFGLGLIIVFYDSTGSDPAFYKLLEPIRPFTSANIVTEEAAGKWIKFGAFSTFS